jgi:hypothetical protein
MDTEPAVIDRLFFFFKALYLSVHYRDQPVLVVTHRIPSQ